MALCFSASLVLADSPAPILRAGTPLEFISDDGVNAQTVHPGGEFRIHLKNDLVLDGATIAPAGTSARLLVIDKTREPGGTFAMQIALSRFHLPAGDLPLTPVDATIEHIGVGTDIYAKTAGTVERVDGRLVIRVPLPFALSNEAPAAVFTPVPARTSGPRAAGNGPPPARRRPTPTPNPDAIPAAPASSTPEPTPFPT